MAKFNKYQSHKKLIFWTLEELSLFNIVILKTNQGEKGSLNEV